MGAKNRELLVNRHYVVKAGKLEDSADFIINHLPVSPNRMEGAIAVF